MWITQFTGDKKGKKMWISIEKKGKTSPKTALFHFSTWG